jgi:hypothetical protein
LAIKLVHLQYQLIIGWIVSAFGFYLSNIGIRIDHLYSYVFVALFLVFTSKGRLRLTIVLSRIIVFLGLFILYAFVLALVRAETGLVNIYTIGQIERYVSLFFTVLATARLTQNMTYQTLQNLLNDFFTAIIILCLLNAIVVFYTFIIGDISVLARWHNAGANDTLTVAEKALKMSRYTGIFATPFESGIVNTLAFIGFSYKFNSGRYVGFYRVALVVIFGGAIMSISKTFILGLLLVFLDKITARRILFMSICAIAIVILFKSLDEYWRGFGVILDYFNFIGDQELIYKLSGGRLSGNSTISEGTLNKKVELLLGAIPFGYGFGNHGTVDNGYYEIFLLAGFPGLTAFILLFIYLLLGIRTRGNTVNILRRSLMRFVIIGSLGAPMITKNRFSILFGVLIVLLLRLRKDDCN